MGARRSCLALLVIAATSASTTTAIAEEERDATPARPAGQAGVHAFASVILIGETTPYGIVNVAQRAGSRRAQLYASMQKLKPNTSYRIVGSTRGCGQTAVTSARTFTATVRTDEDGAVKTSTSVSLSRSLARTRTMSAIGAGGAGLYCRLTGTYDSGTGVLTFASADGSTEAARVGHAFGWTPIDTGDTPAVNAIQRPGRRTAEVYVSGSGLEPDTSYRVVGSTRACGQPVTRATQTFSASFRTDSDGDVGSVSTVALKKPLARTSSYVFIGGGAATGALCVVGGTYDSGTGILT